MNILFSYLSKYSLLIAIFLGGCTSAPVQEGEDLLTKESLPYLYGQWEMDHVEGRKTEFYMLATFAENGKYKAAIGSQDITGKWKKLNGNSIRVSNDRNLPGSEKVWIIRGIDARNLSFQEKGNDKIITLKKVGSK